MEVSVFSLIEGGVLGFDRKVRILSEDLGIIDFRIVGFYRVRFLLLVFRDFE